MLEPKCWKKNQLVDLLSLRLPKDVAAGDNADRLSVLSQDGVVEPFYSSPQRLDNCIIYLDDAHTRGTDLKFPLNFRPMVTLGPKATKDLKVVCGCESSVMVNPWSSVRLQTSTGVYKGQRNF